MTYCRDAKIKRAEPACVAHLCFACHYRNVNDTKSGKRREMTARLSFNTVCELGFRGSLDGMGAPHGSSCETRNALPAPWAAPQKQRAAFRKRAKIRQ
jgi:hypothetical protein